MRRAQYKELIEALGRQLGDRYFQLTEQFHHVFWTGDLNYRMVGLRAADVLDMLERSQVKELYDNYDGMVLDRRDHKLWLGWEEPHMFPNLYPTYKKCVLESKRGRHFRCWMRAVVLRGVMVRGVRQV